MKTVLLIAYHFPPLAGAGVFRTLRLAKYLPEFAWRPVVVTVAPECAGEPIDESLLSQLPPDCVVERRRFANPEEWLSRRLRRGAKPPPDSPALRDDREPPAAPADWRRRFVDAGRNLRDLLFQTPDKRVWWCWPALRASLQVVRRDRPAAIYTTGPPHSTHLVGYWLNRRTGIPWIADFRDPWARAPWRVARSNPWGLRWLPRLESACVRHAAAVILNTQRLADEFRAHYRDQPWSKFITVTNGYDPQVRTQVDALLSQRVREAGGPLRLCHAGSLYKQRTLRPLFEALGRLVQSGWNVRFDQFGACAARREYEAFSEALGIADRVGFHETVPHAQALEHMAAADVLVLIQPGTDLQVPGKLFEMLLFRKAILALVDPGAAADIVDGFHLGRCAPSNDPQSIAEALCELAQPGTRERGEAYESALATFDGRRLTGTIADAFDRVVSLRAASQSGRTWVDMADHSTALDAR